MGCISVLGGLVWAHADHSAKTALDLLVSRDTQVGIQPDLPSWRHRISRRPTATAFTYHDCFMLLRFGYGTRPKENLLSWDLGDLSAESLASHFYGETENHSRRFLVLEGDERHVVVLALHPRTRWNKDFLRVRA